jgi:MoxR-like ATPase
VTIAQGIFSHGQRKKVKEMSQLLVQEIVEKLRLNQAEMNRLLIGRKDEVRGMFLAAMSRSHGILFGPHGEAKSMLLTWMARQFSVANVFQTQIGRETMPDDLMYSGYRYKTRTYLDKEGAQIQEQIQEPITTNRLPEAHFALVRELFDGNPFTLRALNTAINEREWEDNGVIRPMPLISMFGDTNFFPEERELAAFYDRFMLRFVVDRLMEKSLRIQMRQLSYRRRIGDPEAEPRFELIEDIGYLKEVHRAVFKVVVTARIDDLIEEVIARLYDEGIIIYGRRDVRSNPPLQANALLEGREEVTETDLVEVLPHMYWDNPQHRRLVRRVVLEVANPLGAQVQELLDEAREIRDAASAPTNPDGTTRTQQQKDTASLEANTKLKNLVAGNTQAGMKGIQQLRQEAAVAGQPTNFIDDALTTVQRYQKDVLGQMAGMDDF